MTSTPSHRLENLEVDDNSQILLDLFFFPGFSLFLRFFLFLPLPDFVNQRHNGQDHANHSDHQANEVVVLLGKRHDRIHHDDMLFLGPDGDVALGVEEDADTHLETHLTLVAEIGD